MKDAIAALSTHDDGGPTLLQALTSPALPANGLSPACFLLALEPLRGRQGNRSTVNRTCPRTAQAVFWGGCFRLHCC
jgi:hypothetical protein